MKVKQAMVKTRRRIAWLLSFVMIMILTVLVGVESQAAVIKKFDVTAQQLVDDMGVGWNLGNSLDAAKGADKTETYWGNPYITKEMIAEIKAAGFKTIRIPTTWTYKLGAAPEYKVDESWMNRVEEVVKYALDNDMYVILNTHHEGENVIPTYEKQEEVSAMLSKLWTQIAQRFEKYEGNLIFEVMNEPRVEGGEKEWSGATEEVRNVVNVYNQTCVAAIRATGGNNAVRKVMIPTVAACTAEVAMSNLQIPENDNNIIVSVHAYSPYDFAMQYPGTSNWYASREEEISELMQSLYDAFGSKGIPVIIGEFASTDKNNLSDRIAHASFFVAEARKKGISCIWWDNNGHGNGESNYSLFYREDLTWHYPELVNAMVQAEATGEKIPAEEKEPAGEKTSLSDTWELYDNHGSASKESETVVRIDSIGTENWKPHLYQEGLTVNPSQEQYFICKLKSSIDRKVTILMQIPTNNYETLFLENIDLKANETKDVKIYIPAQDAKKQNVKLAICMGSIEGETSYESHTIEVSNARFVLPDDLPTGSETPGEIETPEESETTDEPYKLIWSDEFEGDSLNRNNWNVEVNGYGGWNDELQYYCDSPENIQVSDGTLKITALKKKYEDKEYTSARLNSEGKAEFQFGKIEAKMKLPSFKGAWPAFWMLGANGQMWPACGEIDILETINDESIVYGTAHWEAGDTYASSGSSTWEAKAQVDITQWHTYGIEWDEKQIVWYVDDIKYYALDIASDPNKASLAQAQYLLLNLAVGGEWPGFEIDDTALPATMEVDYVRAYERNENYEVSTEKKDVIESYQGTWSGTIGSWAEAAGEFAPKNVAKDGFEAKLTSVGNDMWGAQASLSELDYTAGNSYTFRATLTSDIDKEVFIKVEGDGNSELAADYISLKANEPYQYETTAYISNTYDGTVSLFMAFGGGVNGETLDATTAMNLRVEAVEFYTEMESDEETTPPTDGETTPPTEGETTPPTDEETTPPTDGGTTPPEDGGTTPPTEGETTPPEDGETTPPEDEETTPPEEGGETTPPEEGGTTPPADEETTPPTDEETTPPTDGGTTPPEDGGTTPPTDGGTTPPEDGETTPPTEGETTPPADGGTTPPTDGETTPPTEGETTPPADGGTTPPTDEETTPPTDGGTTPPTEGGTTPPEDGETTPPTDGEITPPTDEGTTPPEDGETTPPTEGGENTPPADGETTPPEEGETMPPADGGTTTPDQGGSTTPDQGGTTTPDQGGTTTSDQGGTTTPEQGGSTTPDQGGTTTTEQGGSTTSDQGGTTTPDQGDGTTPSTEGYVTEAEAEKAIMSANTDKGDVAGSSFAKLQLKATGKNKQIKLSWKKIKDADGYILYGAQRGKALKKIATLTGSSKTKYTQKKLKKGKYYKYVVVAYKNIAGQNYAIEISKTVHAATTGTKVGNPEKVTIKPEKVTIRKGKTKKLKASYKTSAKKVSTQLAKFRYESSNPEIVTVNENGVVKGVNKGKATIYVYAQNGVCKTVKITIK